MKRRGFTILEALIVIVLISTAVAFFATVYTSAYKMTARSRKDTNIVFQGQAEIENEITQVLLQATDAHNKIPGAKLPNREIDVFGRKIKGYDVNVLIGDKNTTSNSQPTFRSSVITFVYAGKRTPDLPILTLEKLNSTDRKLPKFLFMQEYASNPTMKSQKYDYRISISKTELMQRVMQKEFFGSRKIQAGNKVYLARPNTDFGTPNIDRNLPAYASTFPKGYFTNSTIGINIYQGKKLIPSNISKELHSAPITLPVPSTITAPADVLAKEKELVELLRDTAYTKTLQLQTVSGLIASETVIKDSITWFVGTPVINGLVGQWDANLYFQSATDSDIVSFKDNSSVGGHLTPSLPWQDVRTLAGKPAQLTLGYSGDIQLKVRYDDAQSLYRQFSNGIFLQGNTGNTNRITLDTKNGSNMDLIPSPSNPNVLIPQNSMGNKSYSIIIRAKQADPNTQSSLFTVNMGDNGSIINESSPVNEANGWFIEGGGNTIRYRYDAGRHQTDLTKRYFDRVSTPLAESFYKDNDERKGYRVYELQLKNTGTSDLFNMRLLADNKVVNFGAIPSHYSDLDQFGIAIGSNLEISDILVYDRVLGDAESKTMAEYLLNKYIVK